MPRSASNRFGAKLLYAYRTYRLPAFIFYPELYTITEKTNIKVFGKGSGVTPHGVGRCPKDKGDRRCWRNPFSKGFLSINYR